MKFGLIMLVALVTAILGPRRLFTNLAKLKVTKEVGRVSTPDGATFTLDFQSLISIYEIYSLRCYELLGSFALRRQETIIDVGSNIGIFTVRAAKRVGPGGRVVSVEPHPAALELLIRNIKMNSLKNVDVVGRALGAEEGNRQLWFGSGSFGGTFCARRDGFAIVGMTTLDRLAKELGIGAMDLVKIDTEGSELEVLRGCESLISRGLIRRFVIEVHGDQLLAESVRFLLGHGFKVTTVNPFSTLFIRRSFPTVYAIRA